MFENKILFNSVDQHPLMWQFHFKDHYLKTITIVIKFVIACEQSIYIRNNGESIGKSILIDIKLKVILCFPFLIITTKEFFVDFLM